jgi:hypothetical protein
MHPLAMGPALSKLYKQATDLHDFDRKTSGIFWSDSDTSSSG